MTRSPGRAHLEQGADGLAVLTLENPPGNALDESLLDDLVSIARIVEDDPPTALVLIGAGKAFCTGVDPRLLARQDGRGWSLVPTEAARSVVERFGALARALADAPFPSVAAIEGPAYGGGLELAICCDLRVAGSTATFALPEIRLGLVPTGGGTQRLPRLVSPAWARSLILSGRRCSTDEALRVGLASEVVDRGGAFDRACERARTAAALVRGVR